MKLPMWLRIVVLAGAGLLVGGAGLLSYRWYTRPTTLTVAVGSLDGEAVKIVSALASRLASTNAPVRLKVVESSGALESADLLSAGKTDLAVVRGDIGDLSQAQAVLVLTHVVVLLIAPSGSPLTDIASLKRITVGAVGGEVNKKVIKVLTDEYDLTRAGVTFKPIAPADARQAVQSKEARAFLIVLPLAPKHIALLRGLFLQDAKSAPVLIPIEAAAAIAEKERAFESFDVPKGTLRGAPAVPSDDVTTLRISLYLAATKKLDDEVVTELTQALMNARRDLLGEWPILAQITAPSTDPDAYLRVHPGAAAFYNGTQESLLDKWSNAIFLAPMILGGIVSVLAAAWKFLRDGATETSQEPLDALYALGRRIRKSEREAELAEIESEIDFILQVQRSKAATDEQNSLDVTTLNVAAHRLQNLLHDRRAIIAAREPAARRETANDPEHVNS
jgi:TRAP-type uncharacterized transport system substrate-binding protein